MGPRDRRNNDCHRQSATGSVQRRVRYEVEVNVHRLPFAACKAPLIKKERQKWKKHMLNMNNLIQ